MDKIASFTVNHLVLEPGVYVSRKDKVGSETVTTFDLRMTIPNKEPVINTAELHTLEHLCATFLRNHEKYKDRVIYFGPMGCRTGCYLIMAGDLESEDIIPLLIETFKYASMFVGDIPGAKPEECGNYLDQNLPMAKLFAERYLKKTLECIDDEHMHYKNGSWKRCI